MLWRCDLTPQAEHYLKALLGITQRVLSSGRYILAQEVSRFEEAFASSLGVRHCIGVASGTDALVLALKAIGLEEKGEVITTPFTAIPTISAIVAAGGRPVFVDIHPDTFLIDLKQVPAAVTVDTRAVIPVHLFTQMVDVEALRHVLPSYVAIVEDAAQAHGCRLNGKPAGSLGDMAAFSFYPTKNLGGYGDGGAVVTNGDSFNTKVRLLRNYGKETPDSIILDGINSRLDELQAAYLNLKLPDLETMNEKRRKLAALYREELSGIPVIPPFIREDAIPNFHVYVIKVLERRDGLKQYLLENGIQSDIFYPEPHHVHPAYRHLGYGLGDFPTAESVGRQVLALPMYPELPEEEVRRIGRVIKKFYRV
jgi:dTDP-4-amino-4,6-dideoxygalactose transaminase